MLSLYLRSWWNSLAAAQIWATVCPGTGSHSSCALARKALVLGSMALVKILVPVKPKIAVVFLMFILLV